jgi:hypothetical protein
MSNPKFVIEIEHLENGEFKVAFSDGGDFILAHHYKTRKEAIASALAAVKLIQTVFEKFDAQFN